MRKSEDMNKRLNHVNDETTADQCMMMAGDVIIRRGSVGKGRRPYSPSEEEQVDPFMSNPAMRGDRAILAT